MSLRKRVLLHTVAIFLQLICTCSSDVSDVPDVVCLLTFAFSFYREYCVKDPPANAYLLTGQRPHEQRGELSSAKLRPTHWVQYSSTAVY